MEHADWKQAILELVESPGYRPVKARRIARKLNAPDDQVAEIKKTIKRLIRDGRLVYGPKHAVGPVGAKAKEPQTAENRVVGVFRRIEAGYGFVRPSGPPPQEDPKDRSADIYIPLRKSADAATGDQVVVRLSRRRGGKEPGPRGEIVEILQRESHTFVGTYFEADGSGYVEIDGTLFSRPIFVGDPGARGVKPDDKVALEMVRFPSHLRDGEGVITEVLGRRGQPGVDTRLILREFALPEEFPADVLDEARQQADRFDESIPPDRVDATAEVVLTIDPADARDFDDAISLERLPNGHWRLGVHIADVSHFVRPKTALDRVAYERATSVYLPDRVIPMLPELISNGLASLQPRKVRYAKSAYIEMTAQGQHVATELQSTAIKSRRRLTYEQVDQFLADPEPWRGKLGAKVFELLKRMHSLAMILRRRRFERGALELTMPEVKVQLDKQGRVVGASVVENTESHQIIEEFMLAANEAVAELLAENKFAFLRRVHEDPVPRKLKALSEFVAGLGLKTKSLESRFALQKLLADVAGRPEQRAVNYALLRSLQRAVYSPVEEGHFALASRCYCHFTSPIRRYPDLTIHRMIDALLAGNRPGQDLAQMMVVGENCSEREQRAEAAERELTKLKLLNYLRQRIGEEMNAVITGVQSYGVFAQGIELPAEGLLHVSSLPNDQYHFDRTAHTLAGHKQDNTFRLGDQLRVAVHHVDLDRRELDFRLVGHLRRPEPAQSPPAGSGTAKKTTPKKAASKREAPKKSGKKSSRKKPPRKKSSGKKPSGKKPSAKKSTPKKSTRKKKTRKKKTSNRKAPRKNVKRKR